MDLELAFIGAMAVAVVIAIVVWVAVAKRKEESTKDALARAQAEGRDQPVSLHPVIDPKVCIGSLSCVTACPEGDIIGIVDGAARLIAGASCIGHGRCASECPVDAIRLVMGTSERGVDLPEVSGEFESGRAGVYIVGELGGMGLLKNAMRQGIQVGPHLKKSLGQAKPSGDQVDVAIVGAGPAGLATAASCRTEGLSFRILDQETFGGTVAHYPRQKLVMSESITFPRFGKFGGKTIRKEELLKQMRTLARKFEVHVEEGVSVSEIAGRDGAFAITTSNGAVQAKKVVLAVGRRCTPRKLGVPGEELAKVTYRLIDPRQYAKRRVLVVGGGDSAVEAACDLAEAGAHVSISYRKSSFSKCRADNRRRIEELAERRKLENIMESEVVSIEPTRVNLTARGEAHSLSNDFVIVCAGGVLPVSFLQKSQIPIKRFHGEEHPGLSDSKEARTQKHKERRLNLGLFALGLTILVALIAQGFDYYVLSPKLRAQSPLHEELRSSGPIGHGIGLVATAFMLSNFIYPLRKRWRRLKGFAPINSWMSFHVFVGLMSPTVIAFHAAFQSRNLIASATYVSLLIVVSTGLVGRYILGFIPRRGDDILSLPLLKGEQARLKSTFKAHVRSHVRDTAAQSKAIRQFPDIDDSTAGLAEVLPAHAKALLRRLFGSRRLRAAFSDAEAFSAFKEMLNEAHRGAIQVHFYNPLRRFLSWWRVLHVVLAVVLVVIMCVHIGVSLYLGYDMGLL